MQINYPISGLQFVNRWCDKQLISWGWPGCVVCRGIGRRQVEYSAGCEAVGRRDGHGGDWTLCSDRRGRRTAVGRLYVTSGLNLHAVCVLVTTVARINLLSPQFCVSVEFWAEPRICFLSQTFHVSVEFDRTTVLLWWVFVCGQTKVSATVKAETILWVVSVDVIFQSASCCAVVDLK